MNVVFKNCIFEEEVYVVDCIDVVFENNIYKDIKYGNHDAIYFRYFSASNVRKLSFINDNFVNGKDKNREFVNSRMLFENIGRLEFINSKLETTDLTTPTTTVYADKIILKNSVIQGNGFNIIAKSIENKNSIIESIGGVLIDNYECDFEGTIEAPLVIYNEVDVTCYSSGITILSKGQCLKEKTSRMDTSEVEDITGISYGTRKRMP